MQVIGATIGITGISVHTAGHSLTGWTLLAFGVCGGAIAHSHRINLDVSKPKNDRLMTEALTHNDLADNLTMVGTASGLVLRLCGKPHPYLLLSIPLSFFAMSLVAVRSCVKEAETFGMIESKESAKSES